MATPPAWPNLQSGNNAWFADLWLLGIAMDTGQTQGAQNVDASYDCIVAYARLYAGLPRKLAADT